MKTLKTTAILMAALSVLMMAGGGAAASQSDEKSEALKRLDNTEALTFGPAWKMGSVLNTKSEEKALHAVDTQNAMERGYQAPRREDLPLKGPKGGGQPAASGAPSVAIESGGLSGDQLSNLPQQIVDFLNSDQVNVGSHPAWRSNLHSSYQIAYSQGEYRLFYRQLEGDRAHYSLRMQVFDQSGNMQGATNVLQNNIGRSCVIQDVFIDPNGGATVVWWQQEGAATSGTVKMQSYGSGMEPGQVRNLVGNVQAGQVVRASIMADGEISVLTQTFLAGGAFSLTLHKINGNDGSQVVTDSLLESGGQGEVLDAKIMPDGSLAVVWRRKETDTAYSLHENTFNLHDGTSTGEYSIGSIADNGFVGAYVVTDGNVAVINNAPDESSRIQVFDRQGKAVGDERSMDGVDPPEIYTIAALSNGDVAIILSSGGKVGDDGKSAGVGFAWREVAGVMAPSVAGTIDTRMTFAVTESDYYHLVQQVFRLSQDELERYLESAYQDMVRSESARATGAAEYGAGIGADGTRAAGAGTGQEKGDAEALARYTYMLNLAYLNEAARSAAEGAGLEDIAAELSAKEGRTPLEDAVMETAQAMLADEGDIDEATMQEFAEAVHYVRIAESMRDVFPGVDFTLVTGILLAFGDDQKRVYNEYLALTEDIYRELEALLRIDVEKAELPNQYRLIPNVTAAAKRKMAIDLALKKLRAKDKSRLTADETRALDTDRHALQPLRETYLAKLQDVMKKFTTSVKEVLANAPPVSVRERDGTSDVLMLLDDRIPR